MTLLVEAIAATFLILGGFLAFVAALGIVRMRDVYIRMHASTKAGTLGLALILLSLVLVSDAPGAIGKGLAVFAFILLTVPIGAHLIGRAAYRSGIEPWRPGPRHVPLPTSVLRKNDMNRRCNTNSRGWDVTSTPDGRRRRGNRWAWSRCAPGRHG